MKDTTMGIFACDQCGHTAIIDSSRTVHAQCGQCLRGSMRYCELKDGKLVRTDADNTLNEDPGT